MDYNKWKRFKRSGGFRRRVTNLYEKLQQKKQTLPDQKESAESSNQVCPINDSGSVGVFCVSTVAGQNSPIDCQSSTREQCSQNSSGDLEAFSAETNIDLHFDNNYHDESSENEINDHLDDIFRSNIQEWALQFNISHDALRNLTGILNKRIPHILPKDPRTLLKTNTSKINLLTVGSGSYWHNCLIEPLKQCLEVIDNVPDFISLLINIDGLPVYNSSKHQFWPILCKVSEIPALSPLVIGIYEGQEKPSDLDKYLGPFVDEMKALENGLKVKTKKGDEIIVEIQIKAFICDSPARALIKGVSNFNSKHGCLKCTAVGEYSYNTHTVVFPSNRCLPRNNNDFRSKKYGEHHKKDSPLLKLNIDMVEDIPVSDSLHLVDLGVMKKLLVGWRDGKLGKYVTKWRAQDIEKVSQFLLICQTPKEIHRSTRSLEVMAYWKASEYRTFLYYLSYIILQYVLPVEAYQHFLLFFCGITICSSDSYLHFLDLADKLLDTFIVNFHKFYSKDYITSNIHNLSHLVSEVKKFGKLQDYNAYPFENKLFSIKKLIRNGNNPLAQVIRRLSERHDHELQCLNEKLDTYPRVKLCRRNRLNSLYLQGFVLSSQSQDKWFLSSENHIVELKAIVSDTIGTTQLHGNRITNVDDVFNTPIKSSFLNIFKCNANNTQKSSAIYQVTDIKCKLFAVTYESCVYFAPLLHTL